VLDLQQRVMKALKERGAPMSLNDLATSAGALDQVEAIYKIIRHLHENQREVLVTGDLSQPSSLAIATR
jgi:glucose-6-phosphate isomerase